MRPTVSPGFLSRLHAFCTEMQLGAQEIIKGEPEERLRQPVANLIRGLGDELFGPLQVAAIGETRIKDIGRPDYGVTINRLLCGYCELKAPGSGVFSFKGRDGQQFNRFRVLPNVLYTDGEQWALYHHGFLVDQVQFAGPPELFGSVAITPDIAQDMHRVFRQFFDWTPPVPSRPAELAKLLAPLCRLLRDEVSEALKDKSSRLRGLAADWRNLLFPKATDAQVADACAQVITYGLLLARTDSARTTDLNEAVDTLSRNGHGVLAKALRLIMEAREDLGPSLPLLQRIIERVPERFDKLPWSNTDGASDGSTPIVTDAWIYFYEDFLKEYDPDLREQYGIYYTPVPVVEAQVRMVESVLRGRLRLSGAFAEPAVITLDPAVGTGTYLLAILKSSLRTGTAALGDGAAAGIATQLGTTLHGFEKLAGPYAVAELRVAGAVLSIPGAHLPQEGIGIVLADTLADPETTVQESLIGRELVKEHTKARRIKSPETKVMVVIGNPPYGRHASYSKSRANDIETGGWVRHGPRSKTDDRPLLEDFARPVRDAGKGGALKNLYNLYAYFWRWSCWKSFEQHPDDPGIVCFITASSFLAGDAFIGLRSHLRRWCDDIWIVDLGGDNRGGSAEANVFEIETPVCITLAFRRAGRGPSDPPAKVRVRRIEGTRSAKFEALRLIATAQDPLPDSDDETPPSAATGSGPRTSSAPWRTVPHQPEMDQWSAVEEPEAGFHLDHAFMWLHSGLQMKRRWPIAAQTETLVRRWSAFLDLPAERRALAFDPTRDRDVNKSFNIDGVILPSLASLRPGAGLPHTKTVAYRPWDTRYIFDDARLGDYLRPDLAQVESDKNIFLVTLTNTRLTGGPCLLASRLTPDLHFFRGSYGAKDIAPLYRDPLGTMPNVSRDLLSTVSRHVGQNVSPEEFANFALGVLGTASFIRHFPNLIPAMGGPQLPVPTDSSLWNSFVELGTLVRKSHLGEVSEGHARLLAAPSNEIDTWAIDDGVLRIGETGAIGPISSRIVDYNVSGYPVLKNWIDGRMATPTKTGHSELERIGEAGWTIETSKGLLTLIWCLEALIDLEVIANSLLEKLKDADWLEPSAVPKPTEAERKAPKQSRGGLFG